MGKGSRRMLFGLSTLAALAVFGAPALAQEAILPCPENIDHICMTFIPGDTADLSNGLAVTYERADIGTSFVRADHNSQGVGASSLVVVVQLAVTNNSRNDLQVTRSMFTVALPDDMISANNPGTGNLDGNSRESRDLPVSPFPDPVPNQNDYYDSAVMLHPGDTTRGRLVFVVPANYNGSLRLLCAFPDPQAQSIRYYVSWNI